MTETQARWFQARTDGATVLDFPDDRPLIDIPIDQFTLSDEAIQAVIDGEGPGLCEVDIDILTAIAVGTGVVAKTSSGALCRIRSFKVVDGELIPFQ